MCTGYKEKYVLHGKICKLFCFLVCENMNFATSALSLCCPSMQPFDSHLLTSTATYCLWKKEHLFAAKIKPISLVFRMKSIQLLRSFQNFRSSAFRNIFFTMQLVWRYRNYQSVSNNGQIWYFCKWTDPFGALEKRKLDISGFSFTFLPYHFSSYLPHNDYNTAAQRY